MAALPFSTADPINAYDGNTEGGGGSAAAAVGVDNTASSSNTYVGPGNVILQVGSSELAAAWIARDDATRVCMMGSHESSASSDVCIGGLLWRARSNANLWHTPYGMADC